MLSFRAAMSAIDRSSLTVIKSSDVKRIVMIDSTLDHAGDGYVCDDNIFTYYVLINTWVQQYFTGTKDLEYAGYELLEHIKKVGLIPTIKECQALSDGVICNTGIAPSFLASLTMQVTPDNIGQVLQLLRYPKRLSPAACTKLKAESLRQFQEREKVNKRKMRLEPSTFVRRIYARAKEILSSLKPCSDYASLCTFSSGTTLSGTRALAPRIAEAMSGYPDLLGWQYGTFVPLANLPDYALVGAVPKSYKDNRIIAKEHPGRQWFLAGIREHLWKQMQATRIPGYRIKFSERFVVKDQTVNQGMALVGSVTSAFATIDFSAASDSITYAQACSILPEWLFKSIDSYRAKYLAYKKEDGSISKHLQQMWLSSGNACTSICEGLIFLAVTIAILEVYDTFTGSSTSRQAYAYNDDIIIPTECYEFYVDIITRIGWVINVDKSFATGSGWTYRESCGVEYLNGVPCDTHYFSRKTLSWSKGSISKIVALQHALYQSAGARLWLNEVATTMFPKMTYSSIGDDTATDLWGYGEQVLRRLPAAKFVTTEKPWHYTTIKSRVLCTLTSNEYETVHSRPQTLSSGQKMLADGWTEQEQLAAYEMYCYQQFLQHGPRYLSNLDRLLNVTEPCMSYDKACRVSTEDYIL